MALPEEHTIQLIAETYKLLGDPTRLRVLLTCLEGPIAVGDIAKTTGASQSLVSHHLRLLRAARLVRGTRRNKQVFYQAADDHIARILADMIAHAMEEHDLHDDDLAEPKTDEASSQV
ncbi:MULTISPECIES: metalloregulator ArsR/SmtB family transcription factor [unclassified Devosia]|uniref:ArsR/SmtB family transcription factor n=1 Tax=unclassified Devosia TaxID=196773 RepID=UPI00145F353B|nr:metalloregulator ArsR/SmtB family transcription factor [Devosia sp. MC521]MBJ6987988.1 winged helix-turn-helix transcriptional regulator [Devosia sp. MC521]QMW62061.1 winged helix-turn-helix transcriptional regulator [Devosia sp. MC521]